MQPGRIIKHAISGIRSIHSIFPKSALDRIEEAVRCSETAHRGEIRICIEEALDPSAVFRGVTGKDRAIELFSTLRVWDTEDNNGVLIYILIADHDIEILADRGINRKVADGFWSDICSEIEAKFRDGKFEEGVLTAVDRIDRILIEFYPSNGGGNINELPNRPTVI
jgi:uncharacterized membrane protein